MCDVSSEGGSYTIEVGDVARLNSGGPAMTVKRVGALNGVAECIWFGGGSNLLSGRFDVRCLEKATQIEIDPVRRQILTQLAASINDGGGDGTAERFHDTIRDNTCRVLEDVQDRAARHGCPGDLGLTAFTDYLRGLYPEYYIINPNQED